MRVFRSLAEVPRHVGPSAVALGKFDGIHVGHRALLATLRSAAAERSLSSVVVTFDRNPLALLAPERCPEAITSRAQRERLLEESGVDAVLELPFDHDTSRIPAEEFMRRVLVDALSASYLIVGPDPRFGAGGHGDLALLERVGAELGVEVRTQPPREEGGERVSSTRIRRLLAEGDVAAAARLLGRPHVVAGPVVHGEKRGRELGYPTANLPRTPEGLVPRDGVYAGWLTVLAPSATSTVPTGARLPAAVSVGNNPTFEGVPARQVEAHVLEDPSGPRASDRPSRDGHGAMDLYDAEVEIAFVERVRSMERFDGLDALIDRMGRDVEEVRAALGPPHRHR